MFSKIKRLLQGSRKGGVRNKGDEPMRESQADLSEGLMCSLSLAMKLGLRVYVHVHVGTREHAFSVQGNDDPTLQYLYDLANAQWRVCQEDALGQKLDDLDESRGWEGPDYDLPE